MVPTFLFFVTPILIGKARNLGRLKNNASLGNENECSCNWKLLKLLTGDKFFNKVMSLY